MYKNEEEYEFFTQKLCKCGSVIPEGRSKLGYKVCVQCSTVEQYGCVPITYHKTGNTIQIMSSKDAEIIAKSTRRRGYGTMLGVFLSLVTLSSCAILPSSHEQNELDKALDKNYLEYIHKRDSLLLEYKKLKTKKDEMDEFYSTYDCHNCDEID